MTKDSVNTKYGCCDECGCNITMGHYTHCSRYIKGQRPAYTGAQREEIKKALEKTFAKDTKDSGMPEYAASEPSNDIGVILMFNTYYYPESHLNQRIAEAVAKERERCMADIYKNLDDHELRHVTMLDKIQDAIRNGEDSNHELD